MDKIIKIISVVILACFVSTSINCEEVPAEQISFTALQQAAEVVIPELEFLTANDGIDLAFHEYVPGQIDAVLIFYHGGGAYSQAGYQHIGAGLSEKQNILVVTPDIRGHGDSSGQRGDAPSVKQVFEDVSSFIILMKEQYPDQKLFLGGHSSGAGLVLNYSSWKKREEVSGYLFLSPQLGFRSNTQKKGNKFVYADTAPFISNSMSGTDGNTPAVFFNYSEEVLSSTKNIGFLTVNMANAITPEAPIKQIKQLDQPAAVWIGEKDEIFKADKVISLFAKNKDVYTEIIEDEYHLSILVKAADYMAPWLRKEIEK